MNKYSYIGLGGFIGASLRYLVGNTVYVNIIGCFVLALILYSLKIKNENILKGFTTGLLGSFTTFSTFSGEAARFFIDENFLMFFGYIIFSISFGFIGAYLGYKLAMIMKNFPKKEIL